MNPTLVEILQALYESQQTVRRQAEMIRELQALITEMRAEKTNAVHTKLD